MFTDGLNVECETKKIFSNNSEDFGQSSCKGGVVSYRVREDYG